jgi:hypothetical protein
VKATDAELLLAAGIVCMVIWRSLVLYWWARGGDDEDPDDYDQV